MSHSSNIYNNIYPFYESARQARLERKELRKKNKLENILTRDKMRNDCVERAIVTEGSELRSILIKHKFKAYIESIRKITRSFL